MLDPGQTHSATTPAHCTSGYRPHLPACCNGIHSYCLSDLYSLGRTRVVRAAPIGPYNTSNFATSRPARPLCNPSNLDPYRYDRNGQCTIGNSPEALCSLKGRQDSTPIP